MRKSLLITSLLLLATLLGYSQDQTSKTSAHFWDKGGTFSLVLAQGGTRNWAPGGDRFSLAVNSFLTLYANHNKNRCNWDNMLEANYGLVNTNVAGVIKNDDKLDITSRFSYSLGSAEVKKWRVGVLANFRTQFADGYDYDGAVRKRISAFLAPGILVFSPGIEYFSAGKSFNVHLSPYSARSIFVANRPYELAANYNVKPNQQSKIEAGAFASLNFNKVIIRNVRYRTRLDLSSDFSGKQAGNIDVFWTNIFQMKINKYLVVIYNFDLQYDDDTKIFGYDKNQPGTQLKSILGVGLSVTF